MQISNTCKLGSKQCKFLHLPDLQGKRKPYGVVPLECTTTTTSRDAENIPWSPSNISHPPVQVGDGTNLTSAPKARRGGWKCSLPTTAYHPCLLYLICLWRCNVTGPRREDVKVEHCIVTDISCLIINKYHIHILGAWLCWCLHFKACASMPWDAMLASSSIRMALYTPPPMANMAKKVACSSRGLRKKFSDTAWFCEYKTRRHLSDRCSLLVSLTKCG